MFDPQRRAASRELRAAIKSLIAILEQHEADLGLRKRLRKEADRKSFHLAVEAIACNLAAVPLLDPERSLAVPRRSSVMWSKGRYSDPAYGQHFLDALDLMARPEVGLVESLTRGYRFANGDKQQTTIKPTPAFATRMPPSLSCWESFSREEQPEVLILKGLKDRKTGRSEEIEYAETRETRRLRKEVQLINAHLRKAPLKIVGDGSPLGDGDDGQPIDPTRRTVRRIFNNGSWRDDGRLFDGFWETMRRADRFRLIKVCTRAHPEGERIANVDFSQLFPRLAYQLCKREAPQGDPYDILGEGLSRDGFKKLVNSMLFAQGAVLRWPRETSTLFAKGTKLRDVVTLIRDAHAPIADLFGSGIGFRLMFIESGILIEALQALFAKGITALPLHDSVLVAASEAGAAEEVMKEAFARVTGESGGKLKVDFGSLLQ